ncbi:hypothetical protein SFRURICE_011495 [Spodoptera frugiperda]|nr:hypothetical protein SFRURICE_011495 [Spodoptera frugiperda]
MFLRCNPKTTRYSPGVLLVDLGLGWLVTSSDNSTECCWSRMHAGIATTNYYSAVWCLTHLAASPAASDISSRSILILSQCGVTALVYC